MSDTNIQLLAQLIAEISKFGGADKQKASSLARILLPHIEAYGQEVAREAEKRGWDNCALHTATEYMMLSAKDFREKMANTRSELTQKPAEETEGQ